MSIQEPIKAEAPFDNKKSRALMAAASTQADVDYYGLIEELVTRQDGVWSCTACGKTSNNRRSSDIRKHAETHIVGLTFSCEKCDKVFKSRNVLNSHRVRSHASKS